MSTNLYRKCERCAGNDRVPDIDDDGGRLRPCPDCRGERFLPAPEASLPQRQDSLRDQLRDLYHLANRHGMHDAADAVKGLIEAKGA